MLRTDVKIFNQVIAYKLMYIINTVTETKNKIYQSDNAFDKHYASNFTVLYYNFYCKHSMHTFEKYVLCHD